MCGIIAGVGEVNLIPTGLEMLKNLEYRGYDSAGIAYFEKGEIFAQKCIGGVDKLKECCAFNIDSNVMIGHTRWATHGKVCLQNAQPIIQNNIALVHNGIFENYKEFAYEFEQNDLTVSDTFCWTKYLVKKLEELAFISEESVLQQFKQLLDNSRGSWAICFLYKYLPNCIFFAKKDSPMVLGLGDRCIWIGSDEYALSQVCRKVYHLENSQYGWVSSKNLRVYDKFGRECDIFWSKICNDLKESKTQNDCIMESEIEEGIDSAIQTLENFDFSYVSKFLKNISPKTKLYISGCGTAHNAGKIAKFWLNKHFPFVEVEYASEFLVNQQNIDSNCICIFVSQSGETADTLKCVNLAKERQAKTLGIVNMENSSIANLVDILILGKSQKEYAVAATKSYMAQLAALYALSSCVDIEKSHLRKVDRLKELLLSLKNITIERIDDVVELIKDRQSIYYLGRGMDYLVALEGALKLKEVSYIHVEAMPAGELKHGSIALIDSDFVSIVLSTQNATKEKMKTCISEIKCRGGKVVVFSPFVDVGQMGDIWVKLIECEDELAPFVLSYPLQRLAYLTAKRKGFNPDKPRNLAKSVTVE